MKNDVLPVQIRGILPANSGCALFVGNDEKVFVINVEPQMGQVIGMFLRDQDGRRPVNGGARKFHDDPHWRDCIQFYEYFHGDNGAGLGASHQAGWTGFIARAMHLFATTTPDQVLELGKLAAVVETGKPAESEGLASVSPNRKRRTTSSP